MSVRVAVIGAGAAGLCAAKYLLARGAEVVVFELGSQVGGLWVYESDSGLSPAYASLHLNSEHRVTAYKDFPFADGSPLYPDHRGVAGYLQAYAERFGLLPQIRLRRRVTEVAPLPGGRWRVQTEAAAGAGGDAAEFDAVVVASGHQGLPAHPQWKDDFSGEYLHAHTYRVPEPFRDKKVLVVGMGNSAVDIAADICSLTSATVISARSPVLMMPRMVFGAPLSRTLARIEKPWVPWFVKRRVREWLTQIVHGRMEQWGFVTPKTRTHPTSHTTLMAHFVWNRISARPGIAAVKGRQITFADGRCESFDSVIAGTGYRVDLPFLAPALWPLDGHQPRLFLRVVHPTQAGLFFCGMFNVAGGGNIRMMDDQAAWIAELATGHAAAPDMATMQRAMADEQDYLRRNFPGSPRYALELDPPFYRRQLARERQRAQRAGVPSGMPGSAKSHHVAA